MIITVNTLSKRIPHNVGQCQRVFTSDAHDRCLLIEKIRLNNQTVLCVTCQIWQGSWYSYTPILCTNAESIMRKCGNFINTKSRRRA